MLINLYVELFKLILSYFKDANIVKIEVELIKELGCQKYIMK